MNLPTTTIHNVWQNKTEKLIDEIIVFWKKSNAIPPNVDIHQRAQQVVLVVRNESDQVIGITTSFMTNYTPLKNSFYVFRGMLDQNYRIPGLFIKMTSTTIRILKEFSKTLSTEDRPIGIIAEIENPSLKRARMTKTPSGMTLIGFSPKENPIYVYYFQRAY